MEGQLTEYISKKVEGIGEAKRGIGEDKRVESRGREKINKIAELRVQ
jgi:hypothetical protein